MRKRRFFFVEPSKVGTQHITLIDGYVSALASEASPIHDADLIFCASGSTFDSLSSENRSNVTHRWIPVMNPEKRRLVVKSLLEFFVVLRYVIRMRKGDVVFVSCLLPPALMMLEIANRFLDRRGIYVLLHGELEGLFDLSLQHIRSFGYWSKKWLSVRRRNSAVRLVVIDDFIKHKLLAEFPNKLTGEQIFVIHHPLTPLMKPISADGARLRVCFVGYKTAFKGFDTFRRLSEGTELAEFLVIGSGRIESLTRSSGRPLADTDDYLHVISSCCIAIFPYVAGYACSLSAAALDALSAGTHILATDRPCFVSLQEHLGPETVTICKSESEMAELMQNQKWIEQQRANQLTRLQQLARSKFGIESIRQSFEQLTFDQDSTVIGAV